MYLAGAGLGPQDVLSWLVGMYVDILEDCKAVLDSSFVAAGRCHAGRLSRPIRADCTGEQCYLQCAKPSMVVALKVTSSIHTPVINL